MAGNRGPKHYEVLGVDPSASVAEIKRSYLKLARESHPDFHHDSERDRTAAEAKMTRINEAWSVLGNVEKRSAFDRQRLTGSPRPQTPFHGGGHGARFNQDNEAAAWSPFDTGPVDDFDDRDDRPITSSALPSWLKTVPALGVMFGLSALLVGSLIGVGVIATAGLTAMLLSGLLFLAAPLVALSISRSEDHRP